MTETFQAAATAAAASPHDADAVSVAEAASSASLSLQAIGAQSSQRTIAFDTPPATPVRHGREWITIGTALQAGHSVRLTRSRFSILYDSSGQYIVQDPLGATYGVGSSTAEAVADFFSALDECLAFLRANEARLHPGLLHQLYQLQLLFPDR